MSYDPERIFRDLIADALIDGAAKQWRKRAQTFLDARPTPDDYPGQRTVAELRQKWHELTAIAEACEARARFIEDGRQDWPEVEDVMAETFKGEVAA